MSAGFEIIGLDSVLADLQRIDSGVSNLRPLWLLCGEEFREQETQHFATAHFAPLTPTYATRKAQLFGDKPTLRATDALFESLTQQGAANSIERINDLAAEFGSSDFKAMLHRTGTSKMPARDPLAEPDEGRYETIALRYLEGLMN